MSSLPAQRGWKGEGNAGAPRPGLGQTEPAAHRGGGRGGAPDWLARRLVEERPRERERERERGSRERPGSVLSSLFLLLSPWSLRGSWKESGQARHLKVGCPIL